MSNEIPSLKDIVITINLVDVQNHEKKYREYRERERKRIREFENRLLSAPFWFFNPITEKMEPL